MTPRFNLNHQEIASLLTTFVADGRWNDFGLNETEGEQYLLDFITNLLQKDDPERITKTIYLGTQNTLMALRKDDFLTIQKEPPFSPFSRHNFDKLLRTWIANGKSGYAKEFRDLLNPNCRYQKPKQEVTNYSGGPGHSREDAVIIHANDHEIGVNTEYWYLYYTYGRDWRHGIQQLTTPDSDGRRFDVVDINFPTGETRSIYFNITKCFGKRGGAIALATEHDAARAFAIAWNRLDISALEPHLDDSVHYSSQDIFDELVGKKAVVEYINGKMQTIKASPPQYRVYAELGETTSYPSGRQCVLLAQGTRDSIAALVLFEVRNELIHRIDLCTVAPNPMSAYRTGKYPK